MKSSLDDKIYIKKILESKNQIIYEKIKELSIENNSDYNATIQVRGVSIN